mmetsp:Transcript_29246/g.99465  ORF Transcript_29246/g.99465 Transcript_29246/m.99465 type:complete len:257 (+) Transcript_29246:699-1469(+)
MHVAAEALRRRRVGRGLGRELVLVRRVERRPHQSALVARDVAALDHDVHLFHARAVHELRDGQHERGLDQTVGHVEHRPERRRRHVRRGEERAVVARGGDDGAPHAAGAADVDAAAPQSQVVGDDLQRRVARGLGPRDELARALAAAADALAAPGQCLERLVGEDAVQRRRVELRRARRRAVFVEVARGLRHERSQQLRVAGLDGLEGPGHEGPVHGPEPLVDAPADVVRRRAREGFLQRLEHQRRVLDAAEVDDD